MQNYKESILSKVSAVLQPIQGVTITVTGSNGKPAALYSDNGVTPITGNLTTDANGFFTFYAANGTYTVSAQGMQIGSASWSITLYDPADAPPLTLAQAANPTGSSLIGNGTETVANSLNALQLDDYTALRTYSGPRKSVYVTGYLVNAAPSGIAGMFVRDDSDTTSADNGGTVIVVTNGKRWKRVYQGDALPEWFGALGSGADDTVAVQAAMNIGRYKLAQQYTIKSTVTPPANSRGVGPGSLIKGANCDMVSLSDGAQMTGITLVGIGQFYTGRGVVISTGTDQRLLNCDITGMSGYCVEYSAALAGARGSIQGGKYQRQDPTQSAIKYPDSETNGDRRLLNVDCAGGVLCSLAGSSTTMISGCDTVGINFDAATKKAIVTGNRIATMGGAIQILGIDNVIQGNCIAGDVNIGTGAQNNTVGGNVLAAGFAVHDQSGNATNFVDTLGEDFTPVWTASTTNPTLGNGTLTGRLTRTGKLVNVDIELEFGSTTSPGSGTYTFSLPAAYSNLTVKKTSEGTVRGASGGTFQVGAVVVTGSPAPSFTLYHHGGGNSWGPTLPVTWASGNTIQFSVTFEIG